MEFGILTHVETVGYAGYRGLATAGPSLLAWGMATGSPWMNCGVTSLTALMAKADLNGEQYVAKYGEEQYVELVSAYSLYVGLASGFLAVLGFGRLAQKVPKTVRAGFKWGCSLGVLNAAIPNGILSAGSKSVALLVKDSDSISKIISFLETNVPAATGAVTLSKILYILTHPNLWTPLPASLFFVCTIFVMYGKSFLPKACPPGTEVILATAAATLYSIYTDYGQSYGIVGEIPTLDPEAGMSLFNDTVQLPIQLQSYQHLLFEVPITERCFNGSYLLLALTASVFAAINFLSIVGIASSFETENGVAWSPSRELLSQGVACAVAGLTGSAPVSGSLSRSLVSRMAGTTSQCACAVTAVCWILFLPYMSVMSPTPKAALSAVIVSAVVKGVAVPKDLLRLTTPADRLVGWGTALATACISPTLGFGTGLFLASLVTLFKMMTKGNKKKKA